MNRIVDYALAALLLAPVHVLGAEPAGKPAELEATFDIPASRVSGTLRYPVRAGETAVIAVGDLEVESATVNRARAEVLRKDGMLSVLSRETGTLALRFTAVIRGGEAAGDRNYGVVTSTIDSRGISLTGPWHPRPEEATSWTLIARLPAGYEAVSEAESVARAQKDGTVELTFRFPHAAGGLSFVATDRWEVLHDRHGSVELAAYFFREDRELGKNYLQAVKKYLDLYEKMLTPFPFTRFAVVENFLPTGYSMATFTLLGQDVVRLPFITETSLGHEVLHQWFGNAVEVDGEQGNWAEGLTTYLADHWYEEQKGKGGEYRKQLLVNYAAYVHGADDVPLRQFQGRSDLASRAIGYGKAAMVFHMLRTMTGDEVFFGSLRDLVERKRFQAAAWSDILAAFERKTGKDLSPFFKQWVEGKGLAEVGIESLSLRRKGSRFEITVELTRKNAALPLELPVTVSFLRGGTKREKVTLDRERTTVTLLVDDEPSTAVIDGDYDVARVPLADELPPVIARLLGDERPLIIPAGGSPATYQAVVDGLAPKDAVAASAPTGSTPARLRDADLRASTLAVMGADNPVLSRLFGSVKVPDEGFSVEVRKHPWNPAKVVAIFHARTAAEAEAGFAKVPHYGKYSRLGFDKGRNRDKRIDPAERGIILALREEPAVVDLSLLRKFSNVVDGAADKRIVYVGEYHDRFSDHNVQLQIIQALHKRDRALAVGMEMFQRPYQKYLDAYIAGEIDEQEFLRSTEYFKRWVFDYNFYKPILDYCRAERIPVVALNLGREITEKVSKGGMDSLTDEERAELPVGMDFSDDDYRARIRRSFAQHRGKEEKDFESFLQAQVIWDETMAESIDRYLRKEPGRRMVVVAGGGHVIYGSGIPKRTFRRNGLPYTIILTDGEVEPGIADYVIYPAPLDGMTAPKLLATFREEDRRLVFSEFAQDSPALAAGLRPGDAVLFVDGRPAGTLQDIKLALYARAKGEVMLITIARKRFLLGEKVMTVEVKL